MQENIDLERIKSWVGLYFPFYDVRADREGITFFCRVDKSRLEENFESLRVLLSSHGLIPIIREESGETMIHVIRKIKRKALPIYVNLILLVATLITTILTGALLVGGQSSIWEKGGLKAITDPNNLIEGFFLFSLPLLTILGVHEMAHYYASKFHNIKASLPFFIPVPPIMPGLNIGTFGALISSREPLSNRKILFDVGISGPLAGFLVAIPITMIGIAQSSVIPIESLGKEGYALGESLLFYILCKLILNIPLHHAIRLSPTAFAGWVGLLVTAINLFPVGQLDGGHIARAVLGEKQKYIGWASVLALIFTGWWFFALFVLLVLGIYHPPPLNDISPIDNKRKLLFLLAIFILILCFVPFPVYPIST